MHIHHRRFRVILRSANALSSAALAAVLSLTGCSDSGGAGTVAHGLAGRATSGALVSLTDAPGHFLKYWVTVVAVKLTRADGTVFHTVPTVTQLDLAQPVNLRNVINAREIPIGRYVAAAFTVDFSRATIVVDNGADGLTVAPTHVIDAASREPLAASSAQTTVALQLPVNSPLVIRATGALDGELTFNLAAANTVAPASIDATTAASRVSVMVKPVLTARLIPETPHRS